MISSVSEYLFVTGANVDAEHPHGDLDRIIIDGGVMPLRSGTSPTTGVANSKILRGEDPAFLMEGAYERGNVSQSSTDTVTFRRSIDGLNFKRVISRLTNCASKFISGLPANHVMSDAEVTAMDPFLNLRRSAADVSVASSEFNYGKPLRQVYVSSLFEDLKKFVHTPKETSFVEQAPSYEILSSLCPEYPMQPVGYVTGGQWKEYGGRTVVDIEGNEHHNAYGGTARTGCGLLATAPTFSVPVTYHWFGEFWVQQTTTGTDAINENVIIDLERTGSTITLSAAEALAYARSAIDLCNLPWAIESTETTENITHLTFADLLPLYCVITLGDHTKWW